MSDNSMTSEPKQVKIALTPKKRELVRDSAAKRDGRVPMHKQNRINVEKEPGYHYRLINDTGNRIERAQKAGYEIVTAKVQPEGRNSQDPAQVGKTASQSVGSGVTAYYMRIPQEWHDADQRDKQKRNDEIMSQIKNGFSAERPIGNRRGTVTTEDEFSDE